MAKPNEFIYSSDYRQPYIYEVIDKTVTAPATSSSAPKSTILDIPHNYQHRPLVIGYASTDPNFADKHPLGTYVWREDASTVSAWAVNSYSTVVNSYDNKIQLRAVTDSTSMPAKTIYFRVFMINRVNDSIPGKRQIIPKGDFNLNTDLANIQIYKEGKATIKAGELSVRIPHDLGYTPLVLCWMENDYYPAAPNDKITSQANNIVYSTKNYVDLKFEYADTEDYDFYYMILTERIPDGQSS